MSPRSTRRVVVTGIGLICPTGTSREEAWEQIKLGRSGIAPIARVDSTGLLTTFAGEIVDFDAAAAVGRKEARRTDRYAQFAVAAAREAVAHAELSITGDNADRMGALIGTGMGGMETLEQGATALISQGPTRLSPFFVPMFLPNMASGAVAIALGTRGPNFAPTSACASSAHAIGEASEMIQRGVADVMLAGGGEAPVTRLGVAGFNAMGALSTRNDAPSAASRPFDAKRDGFVLGEGGAVLVLEALEFAEDRGATILGELVGYGATDDANHVVQPAPEGVGARRAMNAALTAASLTADQIDYVNAHGTSTQLNEKFETRALKAVFGDAASRVPISSTKSVTGHLLGAAGALEAGISLLAMRDGVLPPTINQEVPDPDCDLDYVANTSREAKLKYVMSNSMGFGGHNVSLIFAQFS
ncbi:MAG: beta-ketoacyl-ACP synthase II [Chloroflexota bacterium]|nr:beta-ketoacyl-ACP synthase II [Chloroflexota bacterium]